MSNIETPSYTLAEVAFVGKATAKANSFDNMYGYHCRDLHFQNYCL